MNMNFTQLNEHILDVEIIFRTCLDIHSTNFVRITARSFRVNLLQEKSSKLSIRM